MVNVKNFARLAQTNQSLELVGYNINKSKKPTTKNIVKQGVTSVTGIGLIRATGNQLSLL